MNKKKIVIITLAILCAVLLVGVGYTLFKDSHAQADQKNHEELNDDELIRTDIITVDGVKYKINSDIETVLFMGIDKEAKTDFQDIPGENGQSDSLNLLIMNKKTMEAQILQISRDAMVDIEIYGVSGDKLMTVPGQITLQYAYGDGEKRSCQLTKERVSELLYGIPIDSYLSLTMEGMVHAADLIGGVTITVPEDYTDIDPSFVKGAVITLDGKMTERYVRSRDIDLLDSNNQRMQRQSQYMEALIDKLATVNNVNQYAYVYQELEPYMTTNLTAEELLACSEYSINKEVLSVPGDVIEKDGFAQFIVDNAKLKEIVVKTFYIAN